MKVKKQSDDQFTMALTPAEAQVFVKSMNETLKRIPAREYWTRMGAEPDEVRSAVSAFEAALK